MGKTCVQKAFNFLTLLFRASNLCDMKLYMGLYTAFGSIYFTFFSVTSFFWPLILLVLDPKVQPSFPTSSFPKHESIQSS